MRIPAFLFPCLALLALILATAIPTLAQDPADPPVDPDPDAEPAAEPGDDASPDGEEPGDVVQQERELRERVAKILEGLRSGDPDKVREAVRMLRELPEDALPYLEAAHAEATEGSEDVVAARLAATIERLRRLDPDYSRDENRSGGGMSVTRSALSIFTSDADGTYRLSRDSNGHVTVTVRWLDGREPANETREYDSMEEFREDWPEVAGHFGGVTLRLRIQPGPGEDPADPDHSTTPDDQTPPDPDTWSLPDPDDFMRRLPFPVDPSDPSPGGSTASVTTSDDAGTYRFERHPDGTITVTVTWSDGREPASETREFESMEQFRAEWPEVSEHTQGVHLGGGGPQTRPQSPDTPPDLGPLPPEYEELAQRMRDQGLPEELIENLIRSLRESARRLGAPVFPSERDPDADEEPTGVVVGGVAFEELTDVQREALEVPEEEDGLMVRRVVDEAGVLARAGLERHDVLLALDGIPVLTEDDLTAILEAAQPGVPMVLRVFRDGEVVELQAVRDQ